MSNLRRLLVPSGYTLSEVHDALLTAMGWAGYHLYLFRIGRTTYMDIDDDWPDDSVDPSSVRLGDLVGPADRFTFEYDFGDGWEHQVVVEDVLPATGRGRPVCLAGRRSCPPEDVGGPWGYADFLDAITDPQHDRHDELLEWIGGTSTLTRSTRLTPPRWRASSAPTADSPSGRRSACQYQPPGWFG